MKCEIQTKHKNIEKHRKPKMADVNLFIIVESENSIVVS